MRPNLFLLTNLPLGVTEASGLGRLVTPHSKGPNVQLWELLHMPWVGSFLVHVDVLVWFGVAAQTTKRVKL